MGKQTIISSTVLAALVAAPAFGAALGDGVVTNPLSAFEITVDGQFTGGVSGGALQGEWSDVTPIAFIAPASENGTLLRTTLDDPRTNSLLYAAIAPGAAAAEPELYLMYDYLGRTDPVFAPGAFVADIAFPIHPGSLGSPAQDVTVQIRAGASGFFDVFVDLNNDGTPDITAGSLDIEGAVGFGPSTLSGLAHQLIELEVPLLLPPGFGDGTHLPAGGTDGVYSPDPATWSASSSKNVGDPPISSGIFTINPDGSTVVNPLLVPGAPPEVPVPAPATALLLGLGLPVLSIMRRRSAYAPVR